MKHMRKTVTVGGSSLGNRSKLSVLAIALTLALSALVAVPAYAANSDATEPTLWDSIVSFFTGEPADGGVETYAVGDEVENSAVADRDSTNDWNTVLTQDGQVSTQNIGRIWTDKSVFTEEYTLQGSTSAGGTTINKAEGSDFLVGLSALSSTSNLKTVTTTTTPLDIVLVLDVSGSMDDEMSQVYTPAYNPNSYGTYYIQNDNGGYTQLSYSSGGWGQQQGWYYTTGGGWDSQRHYVTPKSSATDSNPDHVQFYTAQSVSKMDSLKSAAGGFIDSVNTMNAALPEGSEQHRIAIVKFASNSSNNIGDDMYEVPGSNPRYQNRTQIVSDFSTNAIALDNAVNALDPAGATRADLGLEQAARVLNGGDNLSGAREGAKKVVIFFTDGNPTSGSSWEDSVALAAVDNAYQLKNTNGATVYSIGVVSGANPDSDPTSDNTSNINKFLHAVSSNYKNATYQYESDGWWGSYQWSLGDRTPAPEGSTETPQYYYAAEDSAQLDQVFQDITTSIGQDNASGSPIEDTTVEGETNPGNLTFNDELGAYMEVAGDTMQIVYADQTFTSGSRTSQNIEGGVVYTYPFSGTVHANEAYGDRVANLSGLQIKVTHYDDPAKGDLVEAVIPADLIPMRNYDVDTENGTMTVSSTYPVRLFYSVQVKAEAAEQLADPSSAIYTSNYVANNTNDAGTGVEFYSNLYTNSDGDGFVGDTTATFKPSNGNRFYYFTANTPLYKSNDGSDTQADRSFINGDNTVYYKDTYWVQTGGTVEDPETGEQIPAAVEKTEYVALSTSDIRNSVRYQNQYQGTGAYLPAQTHNEGKIAGLYAAKGTNGNPTETAGDTLNPTWVDENISARMGNNGRLALELPGTLAVSKNVAFGGQYGNTGFDETVYTEDKDYDINITLTGEDNQPVSGTYKAQVKNAQGAVVSNPTNGYFDITFTNGKATQSIKHGETLYIYGLDAGAAYKVTETAPGDGFTTTYDGNAEGTIEINKTSSTTVTNTYTLQSTELTGSADLKVSKTLSNRDWREGDSFTFQIAAGQSTPNAPMPDETTVTIDSNNKDEGASFGNISYSTPGQYVYIISEVVPTEDALTGVTYSRARYRVVVNVEDDGNGTMTAASTMTQIMDDAGNNVENGDAIDTHTAAFTNTYRTSDQGGTANIGGTKRFVDETGATTLADWTFDFTLTAVGGYPSDENPGEPGAVGTVYPIDAANVPMPADAQGTSKTVTLSGGAQVFNFGEMTYDGNDVGNTYVYAINEVDGGNDKMAYDDSTEYVTVTVTEAQDGNVAVINAVADRNAADVVFDNSYAPESAKLTGNTALGGTKTITGRDMLEGESYNFTLEYVGGVDGTTTAEGSWIELPGEAGMTASVAGAGEDVKTAFNFGDITFNHVGTYTFTISENVPTGEDALGGMTYDNHTCTVKVSVTYNKDEGRLEASVDYGTFGERTGNEFVNEYESSFNYGTTTAGGLNVSKTLTGRDMLDGEFSFTITAADVVGNPALTDDKLAEADKNFSNGGANDGIANVMNKLRGIKFDQDDAGKTFIYTVAETQGNLANVGYDTNVYTVEIKVLDDNDGTMHTETTVKNAAGEQVGAVATWDDQATEGNTVATVAFNNTYTPDEAELTKGTNTGLKVTKKVTGAPTDADFTFTLVLISQPEGSTVGGMNDDGEGNMIATTTVDHDFNADEVAAGTTAEGLFDTLTFDKPGTYTFDVVENEAQGEGAEENWPAGWKYDTSTRQYTVVVTDENPAHATDESQPLYDGKLYIQSVSPSTRNQTFTNNYDHGTVTIGGDADQALQVKKVVTGHSTTSGFNFTLSADENSDVDWDSVEIGTGADKASVGSFGDSELGEDNAKTATFGEITFNEPGIYKFNVTEDEAETTVPSGWEYDDETKTIRVTVSETNPETGEYDGELHATIDTVPVFTNSYTADPDTLTGDSTTFNGTKVLEGRQWLEGETFGFTMKPVQQDGVDWSSVSYKASDEAEAATVNAGSSWTAEATENGNGSVAFWFAGDFTFSKAGTYTFNVTETTHNDKDLPDQTAEPVNGMAYDRHTGVITVEVADSGQGQLVATAKPGNVGDGADQNNMTFTNRYEPTPVVYGDEVSEILGGNKIVDDNSGSYVMADGQFTFMMRAQKPGNPMPSGLTPSHDDEGREIVSVTNKNTNTQNNTATFDFGEITFTKAGTYQYNIYENETGMPAGVSPQDSGRTYTITFVVSEDLATGKLTVDASAVLIAAGDQENTPVDLNQINFTNVYNATATSGSMQIFKTLSGRNWQQGDSFTFDVSMAVDGVAADEMPTFSFDNTGATVNDFKSEAGKLSYNLTITPTASATGNTYVFSTGTATYTHEGTYVYTVTERDVDPSIPNVTKDGKTYTVTVKVTNVNNALQREVTIAPEVTTGRLDFTNTYVPNDVTTGDDATTGITVQKTLSGRAWEDGDAFTFEIARGTNNTDGPLPTNTTIEVSGTAGTTTAATKTFGSMTFTKAMLGDATEKDFAYTITETSTSEDGVTVDSATVRNVTVTVTDDGTGDLKITKISYDNATSASTDDDKQVTNAAAFTNTYDAADTDGSVDYSADLTKVLTGHEWTDGFATFDFQITKVSGTLVGGTELSTDEIPSFEKGTVSVSSKTDTNQNGNDYATFDFGKVTFTQAGTYVYEVSEVKPESTDEKYNPGIDYSGNKATITITVTDKTVAGVSTGQLVASANVENNTFTNNYATGTVDVDVAGGLHIVKNMTGRDIKAGDFTFTVTSGDSAALAKLPGGKAIEVPVAASTSFSDNKASSTTTVKTGLSFSLADAGKSFTYTISETNGGQEIDGVTYDGATHTVRYEVVDGGNGTLTVNAYVDGSTEPAATYTATRARAVADPVTVTFNNSYDADSTTVGGDGAAVTINATKTLANRPLENGMFTFDVTNAADKSDQPKVLLSGSNVGNKVSFNGSIEYTTESLNLDVQNGLATRSVDEQTGQATYTYTYNVSERAVQGVTQNKGSFTITVNVVDDTKGNLTASVVYPDGTTTGSLGFENTYGKTGSDTISISGTKVLSAGQGLNPPDINGEYTFTITGVDENDKALPAELMPGKSSTTNQNGTIDFGSITYTMANVFGDTGDQLSNEGIDTMSLGTRERTFTYTIEEASGSVAGVANDTAPKTVTVKVKDNGDGTITAEKSTEGQPTDFTFTNTYSVTPEPSSLTVNGGFTITKELTSNTGRTPAADEFTFQLIDKTTGATYEAKNAADGSVSMPAVTFSAPGSYGFQLVEVGGDASGMTYDKNIYDVTATVTDDRDGSLSVAWSMPGLTGKDVTFTNDYEADPTSVSVVAGKAISGRPLVDGEFTFQILENGKVVAEATNDANGQIAFPTLSYDKTGEHDYQIVEVKGNAGGVTYDDTIYTMHVSVTDNPQAGALSAKVTYPDGAPVFRNTYTEPVKPVEPAKPTTPAEPPAETIPRAGDATNTVLPAVIAASGITLAVVGSLTFARRRNK